MKFPPLLFIPLTLSTLISDSIIIQFFGVPFMQSTFLSILLITLFTRSWKQLIIPFLFLGLLSLLLYDNFFYIFSFSIPLITILHYSTPYFRSKLITGALIYSFYLCIILLIIPLFILKVPILPPYTFLAFSANLIGASLSLKLLPIVE
jgi:hypothetical protein